VQLRKDKIKLLQLIIRQLLLTRGAAFPGSKDGEKFGETATPIAVRGASSNFLKFNCKYSAICGCVDHVSIKNLKHACHFEGTPPKQALLNEPYFR